MVPGSLTFLGVCCACGSYARPPWCAVWRGNGYPILLVDCDRDSAALWLMCP